MVAWFFVVSPVKWWSNLSNDAAKCTRQAKSVCQFDMKSQPSSRRINSEDKAG